MSITHTGSDLAGNGIWDELLLIITGSPDVEFCGYSIPHPSEALMNIRIQTYG